MKFASIVAIFAVAQAVTVPDLPVGSAAGAINQPGLQANGQATSDGNAASAAGAANGQVHLAGITATGSINGEASVNIADEKARVAGSALGTITDGEKTLTGSANGIIEVNGDKITVSGAADGCYIDNVKKVKYCVKTNGNGEKTVDTTEVEALSKSSATSIVASGAAIAGIFALLM